MPRLEADEGGLVRGAGSVRLTVHDVPEGMRLLYVGRRRPTRLEDDDFANGVGLHPIGKPDASTCTATVVLPIPDDPGLVGYPFYCCVLFSPGSGNVEVVAWSNVLALTVR